MKFLQESNLLMATTFRRLVWPCLALAGLAAVAPMSQAQSQQDYTAVPPLSEKVGQDPMVMLTLATDHQLFIKAFNDYDDLDGDGIPEVGYSHNIGYAGYFDQTKCYTYSGGVFSPAADATVPPISTKGIPQYCGATEWSGNFLNWASMTRADIVKLVLYGGYRSTDTAGQTILERTYLPHDAHSFAKYYANTENDIGQLADVSVLNAAASCADGDAQCVGYTFCNTSQPEMSTDADGEFLWLSQDAEMLNQPPLVRMVKGNYSLWGSSERYQCLTQAELKPNGVDTEGLNAGAQQVAGLPIYGDSPEAAAVADMIVRVEVCNELDEDSAHKCMAYGNSVKPVGILQEVGGNGDVRFGLMTRGYNTNKSFGVLRKNVVAFTDEINDDGTFNSAALQTSGSIISTLDALRLVDYRYDYTAYDDWPDNYYRGTYMRQVEGVEFNPTPDQPPGYNFADPDNANYDCIWGLSSFDNGECRNWGNPFSELMAESYRYLSGEATATVTAPGELDGNLLPGLTVAQWEPPTLKSTQAANADDLSCVNMNLLGFNASAVSYDGDELQSMSTADLGLSNAADSRTIVELTNEVGTYELDSGKQYFVGENGTNNDQQCTPKNVTNLADVRGTCPDAPRLEGSYLVAGMSHFAKTNDVLPDVPGTNSVTTFGVNLAGALPNITLEFADRTVTIIPACHNDTIGGNCALVDFKPLSALSPGADANSYFVSWEDSEQGSDYDQDLNGVIRYEITGDNTLKVSTQVFNISTEDDMDFGFVMAGTGSQTQDTLHPTTRVVNEAVTGCGSSPSCAPDGDWQSVTFTVMPSAVNVAESLKSPLWYATRWGNFDDFDGDGIPDPGEWERNTNDPDSDPLGYVAVVDPNDLQEQVRAILRDVALRPSTGAGTAISSNTLTGEGLMLQSYYKPELADDSGRVSWVGTLNGLFVDNFGNIREDTDGSDSLTAGDKILEIAFDPEVMDTLVTKSPIAADGTADDSDPSQVEVGLPLSEIRPVWSATEELAGLTNAQKIAQRAYGVSASTGRHIFTSIDRDGDGITTGGNGNPGTSDVLDFIADNFDDDGPTGGEGLGVQNQLLLDADNSGDVVNFIRGVEDPSLDLRSRSIDFIGNEEAEPWLLGDITHSTPAVVGRPSAGYDTAYSDVSYSEFRASYVNRRQVAYVGANDGLLHAFNMGNFNQQDQVYDGMGHPLGGELWAYAPYNLLPHMKWLTEPGYDHVYYVDSSVNVFDVNIFPDEGADETYPNGWGTILVVGMRFGGGPYDLPEADFDNDGTNDERTLRSAYMIFDVTDPESAPKLIAEVTDEDLGYTLMEPDVMSMRRSNALGGYDGSVADLAQNDWYLVFGSGPQGEDGLTQGVSDKPASLFYLDLRQARQGTVDLNQVQVTPADENGFVSGISIVDWDGDFVDDSIYVSVVGDGATLGNGDVNLGGLYYTDINPDAVASAVLGTVNPFLVEGTNPVRQPFSTPVTPVRNLQTGEFWVNAGTGRLLVADDVQSDYQGQYYGIKASGYNAEGQLVLNQEVDLADMVDISGYGLYEQEMYGATVVQDQSGANTWTYENFVADIMNGSAGWYRPFYGTRESSFTAPTLFQSALLVPSYIPGVSECEALGTSNLYAWDVFTGLPASFIGNLFRDSGSTASLDGETYSEVGDQLDSRPGVITDSAILGNNKLNVADTGGGQGGDVIQMQDIPGARRSWREVPMDELN